MCANATMKRPRGFMSSALFDRVLAQVEDAEISKVNLATIGEPLLHPECVDFVRRCKRHGLFVLLNTSLQPANAEAIEGLLDSNPDVLSISMEGTTKEEYEAVRVGASFERLTKNLATLKQLLQGRSHRPEVVIRSVRFRDQGTDEEAFRAKWGQYCDRFEFPSMGNQGGYLVRADLDRTWEKERRIPCRLLWTSISVTYDGFISYCCVDFNSEMVVGSVITMTLREAWSSEQYHRLRAMHLKGDFADLAHCQVCSATFEHWTQFPTIYRRTLSSGGDVRR